MPTRAGPYELLSVLGQGASGTVYLARRPGIERMFALKLLAADLDTEGRARVQREAQIASRIDHPGIVRVVDFGVLGPQLYIVMEHVPGPTLRDVLAQGSLPPDQAASIVAQIGKAIDAAHAAGVVHRDLKPANVILDARDNLPKVTDFGLARDTRAAQKLTKPGEVIGTPYYMAPEQIHGAEVDARTDVYAMGVLLYELLTGKRPFEGKSVAAVVHAILNTAVVPPRKLNAAVPPAIEACCLRALARKPADRFTSAHQVVEALSAPHALAAAPPARASALLAAVLGGLSAGLVVLVAWAVIAFANARSFRQPLADARQDLLDRGDALREARRERDTARVRRAERQAEATRRAAAAAAAQQVAELEPVIEEIARASLEPTGQLRRGLGGLIRDMQAVEHTEAIRANLLYNLKRFAEAKAIYDEARAAGGEVDPELAVVCFRACTRLGDRQSAEDALLWVLQTHPQSLPGLFAKSVTGAGQLSVQTLRELKRRPDVRFNYFHNLEVMGLTRAGQTDEALQACREAIDFDPSDTDAYVYLVQNLLTSWQRRGMDPSAEELAEGVHAYRVAADLSGGADPALDLLEPELRKALKRYGRDL